MFDWLNDLDKREEEEPDYEFESQKLLQGLMDDLNKIEEDFKKEATQIKVIEDEEAELRSKLRELAERKAQYTPRIQTYRVDLRRVKREIDQAELKVQVDVANKKQQEELERQGEYFDKITASAKWRDFAYDHQLVGARFLATARRAICADSMGLGKTMQILMTLDMIQSKRALVVCPGEVASIFQKEIKRWTRRVPINISRMAKKNQEYYLKEMLPEFEETVTIINFESWNRNKEVLTWLKQAGYDTVIIDESHNIKETDKNQYKGVAQVVLAKNKCTQCDNIFDPKQRLDICPVHGLIDEPVSSVENVYCMTGTPLLNKPQDIFSSLHLIKPDIFTTRNRFNEAYTDYSGEGWGYDMQAKLAEEISGFYIRRTRESAGIILPPQTEVIHEIEVTEEEYPLQHEIMRLVREEAQLKIKEAEDSDSSLPITSILAMITRNRQATVWPGGIWVEREIYDTEGNPVWDFDKNEIKVERINVGQYYQQSAKLDKAEELYHELVADGHRVVFFSQFKEALNEMHKRLGNKTVLYTGDTSPSERQVIKQNFDASVGEVPKWDGVLCHYVTGGVGLTLTSATAMIILDEEWNDGKKTQAYDRINRIGQTKETQVHVLRHVGEGSIDEWLANLIERKSGMVNGFNVSMTELKGAFE